MAFLGTETANNTVFSSLETLADIPLTDYAAWNMYPKRQGVYRASAVFAFRLRRKGSKTSSPTASASQSNGSPTR